MAFDEARFFQYSLTTRLDTVKVANFEMKGDNYAGLLFVVKKLSITNFFPPEQAVDQVLYFQVLGPLQ